MQRAGGHVICPPVRAIAGPPAGAVHGGVLSNKPSCAKAHRGRYSRHTNISHRGACRLHREATPTHIQQSTNTIIDVELVQTC